MKILQFFTALAFLTSTLAFAQSGNYVVTNNDPAGVANSATIFQVKNRGLELEKTIKNLGEGGGITVDIATPRVVVNENGASPCLFVSDEGSSDIASFQLPGLKKVGNYTDPNGKSGQGFGLGLAARGNFLFAAYNLSINIGVWQIGSNCSLSLLGSYNSAASVSGLRVSPDGKTLVVGYGYPQEFVDSFSVGSAGALTELGPFSAPGCCPAGVDITKDGKYAVFGSDANLTQLEIFPIDSDGTLGKGTLFGGDGQLGEGDLSSAVWFSPNDKFIFVSNSLSGQITSLGFSENPLTVSYIGITTLRNSDELEYIGGLATASLDGNGGGLYVAEFAGSPQATGLVGLLQINPDGTTTEVPGSPFSNGVTSALLSLAAYPPRRF